MTNAPVTTAPAAEATSPNQDVLNDLIKLGHRLLRLSIEQAEANILPVPEASKAFERDTRSIRRCVWLERYLAKPMNTIDRATDRTAARKQVIRTVEDIIQRHPEDPDESDTLHDELMDRLDTMDLEDEISSRPIGDVITDIIRDLGLAAVPGNHPWKRRTPADVAELCARAAQPLPEPQTANLSAEAGKRPGHAPADAAQRGIKPAAPGGSSVIARWRR